MEEEQEALDKPISLEEIIKALEETKLGKAPGLDGFTANFYKIFKNELAQWFQVVVNNILERGELPHL